MYVLNIFNILSVGFVRFDCLRSVPAYEKALREGFDRCLDLYLCPRTRKKRVSRNLFSWGHVVHFLLFLHLSIWTILFFLSFSSTWWLIYNLQINIDPESLKPKLPSKKDLRPYPRTCYLEFKGHNGPVKSLSVEATGQWIASGTIFIFYEPHAYIRAEYTNDSGVRRSGINQCTRFEGLGPLTSMIARVYCNSYF